MANPLSLFPARIRFVNADGTLTPEAYRSLQGLLERVGGASGAESFSEYISIFFDDRPISAEVQESIRAIDELRSELASVRGQNAELAGLIEEQGSELAEMRSASDLLTRLEVVEAAIAGIRPAEDLRDRIEQIEGRLA